jgi:ABC-type nickel/cobalt efflux system permease component RcnA
MKVTIRFGQGRKVQKSFRKKQKAALAVAALLAPICVVAWVLAIWRIGADLGVTGGFAISSGLFSHWQVLIGFALLLQFAFVWLNRYGRSGARGSRGE